MTKKIKPKKKSQQKTIVKTEIVDTNCVMYIAGNSLRIRYNDSVYVTNIEYIDDKLKETVAHIRFGKMTENGIDKEVDAWVTKKGKSVYFSPEKNVVLISSYSGLQKLLAGEFEQIKFGIFK